MKQFTFTAFGNPKGQPRVKACVRGKHAGVYTPGTADEWKFAIIAAAKDAWDGVTFTGPVRLSGSILFARPKKHFRSNGELRDDAPTWHIQKPDRDNCEKLICDALTAIGVWGDDCQVCCGAIEKRWTGRSINSGSAIISITEVTT